MQYAEGQNLGSITYADNTFPLLYGVSQEVVDTGNVELFGLSAPDHLIMFAHSDKAFNGLYENSELGAKISVTINGCLTWYEIINAYWITQTEWESEESLYNFYYTDNIPLTLVTCNHRGGVRGRWIVQCTYSSEPIEQAVINTAETDVMNENIEASKPEAIEEIEVIEENEPIEIIEETPVASITPLNLLRMKKIYVSDYIEKYRGL